MCHCLPSVPVCVSCSRLQHLHRASSKPELLPTPLPAHLSRSSYTCFTRNNTTHGVNGYNTTPVTSTTPPNTNFSSATTTNNSSKSNNNNNSSSSSSNSSSYTTTTSTTATPAVAPSPKSGTAAGCARAAAYRWHRKRRWIRVGNVFQRGISVNTNDNSSTNSSSNNCMKCLSSSKNIGSSFCKCWCNSVRQPTFVVPCSCVAPYSCVLCARLPLTIPPHTQRRNTSTNTAPQYPEEDEPHTTTPHKKSSHHLKSSLPTVHHQALTPSPLKAPNSRQQQHLQPSGRVIGVCKTAWFPRVATSCRSSCNSSSAQVPLHERIGAYDTAYHPVLSHPTGWCISSCYSQLYKCTSQLSSKMLLCE